MDSLELECTLLDTGRQRRDEAATLALGGGGAVVGARGGGSHCVDHERAVFAGGPRCLNKLNLIGYSMPEVSDGLEF